MSWLVRCGPLAASCVLHAVVVGAAVAVVRLQPPASLPILQAELVIEPARLETKVVPPRAAARISVPRPALLPPRPVESPAAWEPRVVPQIPASPAAETPAEPQRAESQRRDPSPAELQRPEPQRAEPPRTEHQRAEVRRPEPQRAELRRAEPQRQEQQGAAPARAEPQPPTTVRPVEPEPPRRPTQAEHQANDGNRDRTKLEASVTTPAIAPRIESPARAEVAPNERAATFIPPAATFAAPAAEPVAGQASAPALRREPQAAGISVPSATHATASGDAARAGSTESRATGAPMAGPVSGHGRGPGGSVSAAVTSSVTTTATPRGGYQVRPSYPASARRLGVHGTTLLRVFVSATGRVTEVTIETSAGHPDLDRAAADAVRRWLFEPGLRGSEPIGMWVLLPVEFRLK